MISRTSEKPEYLLKKQKFKILTSHQVEAVTRKGDTIIVQAKDKKGSQVELKGDYCLVSVGRKPFTDGLNLDAAGVQLSDRGQIEVNDHLQTNVANIYAIGDIAFMSSSVFVITVILQ